METITSPVELIAHQLGFKPFQVKSTMELLEAGNTVPFITRYRKEMTGSLNEDQIRAVETSLAQHRALSERKATVLEQIQSQGKLTPELERQIQAADKLKIVEDIYLPYKPKKRTLATIAKEQGLEPLAMEAWLQLTSDASIAHQLAQHVDPQKELATVEDVAIGIGHIIAEMFAENLEVREEMRRSFWKQGEIESSPTPEEEAKGASSPYRDYFDFSQPVATIPPHRTLALNRGESEKALRVHVRVPEEEILARVQKRLVRTSQPNLQSLLLDAIKDGYKRLLYPSLSREVRSELTQIAQTHAIHVFGENLKRLLLAPPLRGMRILGIDPGLRTGCKWAAIDDLGKLLEVGAVFPHQSPAQRDKAAKTLVAAIAQHRLQTIAIGNGTACRETEEFVAQLIADHRLTVQYTIVSEAGASVYSASPVAQQEFPELEASYRGTVSIARRLQDPLAELVKIDSKSIGVGLYQHDVDQKELSDMLDTVVTSCVNYVGVDINTASVSLLQYVSGLNAAKAKKIYEKRMELNGFKNRQELRKVKGIGPETFLQAAGFLKIADGDNPLDNTQIHPESYDKVAQLLDQIAIPAKSLQEPGMREKLHPQLDSLPLEKVAQDLGVGVPTLRDIVENLKKPGRDPRDSLPKPLFRKEIMKLEDLAVGMQLQGTVRNVVDFGAFVDIGVKEDGLVHVSQLADRYVKNPLEVVAVGDIVTVRVVGIDLARRRIALSLKK